MSKFTVGDRVRLADDVGGEFAFYGVQVGLTGTVSEIVEDDPFGLNVAVTLDMDDSEDSAGGHELLFWDFELEAI